MKVDEFVEMWMQDNETESDKALKLINVSIIDCLRVAALQNKDVEIENTGEKTLKGAFKAIEQFARDNDANCTGIFDAINIVAEYVGLKFDKELLMLPVQPSRKKTSNKVKLEDFY